MTVWRRLLRRTELERELDAELQDHIERRVVDLRRTGLAESEARRRAQAEFGGLDQAKEYCRDVRPMQWLEVASQDVRQAWRSLRAHPALSAAVILSLALGIGASAAIFSAVSAILLRQLPVPDADRLAVVWKGPIDGAADAGVAPANAIEIVERLTPLASAVPFTGTEHILRGEVGAERVGAMRVGAGFFGTLGVAPAVGRDFVADDDRAGAAPVAIISDGLWDRHFGRDPRAIGRALPTGATRPIVVGVMPRGFRFPQLFGTERRPEIWVPLAFSSKEAATRGAGYMFTLLKRHAGVPPEVVQRELDALARTYAALEPPAYGRQTLTAIGAYEQVVGKARPVLVLLWAAVSCVLLIACANAANVTLSRASARSRELAVRASIGASRLRLFRQLVTESLVMAGIAATAGLVLATLAVRSARQALAGVLPRAEEIVVDWRVLAFTIAAATLTCLVVGAFPALRLSSVSPRDALGQAATRTSTEGAWSLGMRRVLLVGQIAVAVLLATVAVLLGRSFAAVQRADLGFQPDSLLTFEVSLPEGARPVAGVAAFYEQLLERIESLPEVASAGALSVLPMSGGDFGWTFLVADTPVADGAALPYADVRIVTPGAVEALGVPLHRGRSFRRSDTVGAEPVALVNATLARRMWPGEDPVGKQLKLAGPVEFVPWMTVIGVVADVKFGSPDATVAPAIYRPLSQHRWRDMAIVVRTPRATDAVVSAVRNEVTRLDATAAVLAVREFTYYLSQSVAERRLVITLVGAFAAAALVLALVGVYGLFSYAVTSRTREIGVRIALGATQPDLVWMLMRQALMLGAIGLVGGAAGVVAARRLIESQLVGVGALDPATLGLVSSAVLAMALVASYLPARRAAGIDPTTALRAE